MKKQNVNLEPCPFCGNKADWNERTVSKGVIFYIECVNDDGDFGCCSQRGGYAHNTEAIKAWNTRNQPTANEELIAALELAMIALKDLGACNDPKCSMKNCLHILPKIEKILKQYGRKANA